MNCLCLIPSFCDGGRVLRCFGCCPCSGTHVERGGERDEVLVVECPGCSCACGGERGCTGCEACAADGVSP